jgi:hypothetical protein
LPKIRSASEAGYPPLTEDKGFKAAPDNPYVSGKIHYNIRTISHPLATRDGKNHQKKKIYNDFKSVHDI